MSKPERLGPPPVEQLSDTAWARVERGLWARLDQAPPVAVAAAATRSWRWVWFAAPTLAAAAVIAIIVGTRGGDPALDEPPEPARVVSGASPSSLLFGDAHVTLDAESAVVMSRDTAKPTAVVERGGAWFSIAPRRGRAPFVVVAGDTMVRVVGTRFRVSRSAELAVVEVERGLVDVQFRGIQVEVGAGERWTSEQPNQVSPVKTAQLEPPKPADVAPVPPVDDTKPTQRTTNRRPKQIKAKADEPKAEEPKAEEPPAVDPLAADTTDRARFKEAEALETRDPDGAIAAYLAVAKSTTKWAALALYSAGRLAHDRKQPRAKALLEMYLQRFPQGRNIDDVRELLARLGGSP